MRRALLRAGVVVWAAGASAIGVAPTVASADAPEQQGWWTVANPGGLPANPADAAVDVPKDGLLIQAGPDDTPTAYAGLIYTLGKDETASALTLKVAPNSATTPVASLELCPLKGSSLDIEQGGPMTDAPAYDCSKHASASLDAGGNTFKFTVDSLIVDNSLAIAILPGDPASRVVLSKPDESSLATTPSLNPDDSSYTSGTPTTEDTSDTPTSTSTTTDTSAPAPQSAPNVGAPPSSVDTGSGAPPARSPEVAPDPDASAESTSVAAAPVAATSDAGGSSGVAVLLLVAGLGVGALLWAMAGRGPLDAVTEA